MFKFEIKILNLLWKLQQNLFFANEFGNIDGMHYFLENENCSVWYTKKYWETWMFWKKIGKGCERIIFEINAMGNIYIYVICIILYLTL